MADVEFGEWHFRDVLERLALIAEVGCLLERGEVDLATHLGLLGLAKGYRPESDDRLAHRVDAVLKAVA